MPTPAEPTPLPDELLDRISAMEQRLGSLLDRSGTCASRLSDLDMAMNEAEARMEKMRDTMQDRRPQAVASTSRPYR